MFFICFSNTFSKCSSWSFKDSICYSLGSRLARISVVRCVSTCLLFCKSFILNLYLYRSVSRFFSLSWISRFSCSSSAICFFFSSSVSSRLDLITRAYSLSRSSPVLALSTLLFSRFMVSQSFRSAAMISWSCSIFLLCSRSSSLISVSCSSSC